MYIRINIALFVKLVSSFSVIETQNNAVDDDDDVDGTLNMFPYFKSANEKRFYYIESVYFNRLISYFFLCVYKCR